LNILISPLSEYNIVATKLRTQLIVRAYSAGMMAESEVQSWP